MSNMEASRSKMMVMPDDMIADILNRLEVKSLLRCRCVCKSWNMITHQKFFNEKYEKRLNKYPQIVFQYKHQYVSNGEIYVYQYSCNGLVLEAKAMANEYRIRNPATKQVLRLKEDKSLVSKRCKAILGFDSSTGNYKMISLCRDRGRRGADIGVIMLTIGSDDDWSYQSLDITLLGEVWGGQSKPHIVCHNDVCYALSFCFDKLEKSDIIRFTLDGKSSMHIKLPRDFTSELVPEDKCRYGWNRYPEFRMFIIDDDKLSIGFIFRQEFHVWVLENYNEHIWSEKNIISLEFIKDFPTAVTIIVHNSPKLSKLRLTIADHYLEYDTDSKNYTCLSKGSGHRPSWYHLKPSLVSLKGMCSEGHNYSTKRKRLN